jgi:hypothetical protein
MCDSLNDPMMNGFLLIAGSLALGVAQAAGVEMSEPKPEPELATVLQKIRGAMGCDALANHVNGVEMSGRADVNGLQGPFTLSFTPDGRFCRRVQTPAPEVTAFDGTTGWGLDWTGVPRVLELENLEAAETSIWVATARWLAVDSPFVIHLVKTETRNNRVALGLRLKNGIDEAQLLVDPTTWLPAELRRRWVGGQDTWLFQDYRRTLGFSLPHTLIRTRGGLSDTYRVEAVRPAESGTNPYKLVLTPPADTRFDPAASARVEVRRGTPTGHLFVRPKVNGQSAGWFALDTGAGAGLAITAKAAEALGMKSFGQVVTAGAGKPVMTCLRQGRSFGLGPVALIDPVFVELPRESADLLSRSTGMEFAGVCGYSLFARSVAVLDSEGSTLDLYDPEHYTLSAGRWQAMKLHGKIPCVGCKFDGGHEGTFRLDTGAANGSAPVVVFHSPAVEKLKLLDGRSTQPVAVGGVGGVRQARLGHVDSFELGGRPFGKVPAVFMLDREGALADPYTVGTLGGGFLTPFQLVLDYPHRRLAFIAKPPHGS